MNVVWQRSLRSELWCSVLGPLEELHNRDISFFALTSEREYLYSMSWEFECTRYCTLLYMMVLSGSKCFPLRFSSKYPISLKIRIKQTVKEQSVRFLQPPTFNLLLWKMRCKLTASEWDNRRVNLILGFVLRALPIMNALLLVLWYCLWRLHRIECIIFVFDRRCRGAGDVDCTEIWNCKTKIPGVRSCWGLGWEKSPHHVYTLLGNYVPANCRELQEIIKLAIPR